MTLDEEIKHCEEVAEELDKLAVELKDNEDNYVRILGANYEPDYSKSRECVKQATENRQLAEWLKALKEIWDSGDCNDCRNGQCEWKPKLGQLIRFNCPHYIGVANGEVNADDKK